jgi:hypothetical protein
MVIGDQTISELRGDTLVSNLVVSDSRRVGGGHHQGQSSAPVGIPCQRCADAGEYAPASVRFAGEIVCGFHAYGAWFDKPARVYRRSWA